VNRANRRFRTEKIIARRFRRRKETAHHLYLNRPSEPSRSPYIFEVKVGHESRSTFHEWIAKPGILRKNNGAHGRCSLCDCERNPKRQGISLEQELELLDSLSRISAKPRHRKDTRRWCRGKVGVPHSSEWRAMGSASSYRLLVCLSCGKHLDWCFHASWWPSKSLCKCPLGRSPPRARHFATFPSNRVESS
jgi:hypothetical protein